LGPNPLHCRPPKGKNPHGGVTNKTPQRREQTHPWEQHPAGDQHSGGFFTNKPPYLDTILFSRNNFFCGGAAANQQNKSFSFYSRSPPSVCITHKQTQGGGRSFISYVWYSTPRTPLSFFWSGGKIITEPTPAQPLSLISTKTAPPETRALCFSRTGRRVFYTTSGLVGQPHPNNNFQSGGRTKKPRRSSSLFIPHLSQRGSGGVGSEIQPP